MSSSPCYTTWSNHSVFTVFWVTNKPTYLVGADTHTHASSTSDTRIQGSLPKCALISEELTPEGTCGDHLVQYTVSNEGKIQQSSQKLFPLQKSMLLPMTLSSICLEMVSRIICSILVPGIKARLTSLQFPASSLPFKAEVTSVLFHSSGNYP